MYRAPGNNTVLWNAMINPLLGTTLFGALWYQGNAVAVILFLPHLTYFLHNSSLDVALNSSIYPYKGSGCIANLASFEVFDEILMTITLRVSCRLSSSSFQFFNLLFPFHDMHSFTFHKTLLLLFARSFFF